MGAIFFYSISYMGKPQAGEMHTAQWTSRIADPDDARVANASMVAWLQADVGAHVGADVALRF